MDARLIDRYSQTVVFLLVLEELTAPPDGASGGGGSTSGAMDGGVPGTMAMNS